MYIYIYLFIYLYVCTYIYEYLHVLSTYGSCLWVAKAEVAESIRAAGFGLGLGWSCFTVASRDNPYLDPEEPTFLRAYIRKS